MTGRLESEREAWSRLRVTRETAAGVLAELSGRNAETEPVLEREPVVSEVRVVGAVMVPHWREGLPVEVLPDVYRDIVEVVTDESGPMRAKQIVPRIGLPATAGKIEGTRGKLKTPGGTGLAGRGPAGAVRADSPRSGDESVNSVSWEGSSL